MKFVKPASSKIVRGTASVPGDKSISHRAAMIASVSTGNTRISNYAGSRDCSSTLRCLADLGIEIRRHAAGIEIAGAGIDGFREPEKALDCGNSGTTLRLMAGMLASRPFETVLTGDASLMRRPMSRITAPLAAMGAEISTVDGTAPLRIGADRHLTGIEYAPPMPSAQVKSCILLAGLKADGITAVIERIKTRDHTERMLRWFGVEIDDAAGKVSLQGGQQPAARDIHIPGDISSAVFFIAAAAGLEGSELTITNVGLNPTRTAVLDVMRELGAEIDVQSKTEINNEPVGTLRTRGGMSNAETVIIDGDRAAPIIDEIPMLAVLATRSNGGIEIRNAQELRVKESDRIMAVVENLRRMKADVEEFADGFRVGPSRLTGARLDAFDDHRIAMAFFVAGLFAEGETEIAGRDCADVSFPGFYRQMHDVIT